MESDSGKVRILSFDAETFGQPQSWVVHHRGLEYTGEVIVAETVESAWGQPLPRELCFRVVFYTVPRRIPSERIQDARIAMAVPRRAFSEVWQSLGVELRSIHEVRERYLTARDDGALGVRQSMEDRETILRDEMTRRYATAYTEGRVYTQPHINLKAGNLFAEDAPESWADRMVAALLGLAHADLPLDHSDFPYTLTVERVATLYGGLFQGAADAEEVVRAFGPGLGLTRQEFPTVFDAGECRVARIIKLELESRQGEMLAGDLLDLLAVTYSLTRGLALLYLIAFVRHAGAEIVFNPDHDVESIRGGRFLGDRITADLVPEVRFRELLSEHLGAVRLSPSVTRDTIRPYAALLVHGVDSDGDAEAQERELLDVLAEMASQGAKVKEGLRALETSLGAVPSGAAETLRQLQSVYEVSSYRDFHSMCVEAFGGPAGLDEALDLYHRLERLTELSPDIAMTNRYLAGMTFGREHRELELERDALSARIEPESLMGNPSLWGSIDSAFRRLRSRYADAYVSHHARYHMEASQLNRRLEGVSVQVQALTHFNEMRELGEPLGTELPETFNDVAASIRACSVGEDEPALETTPFCQICLLPLQDGLQQSKANLLVLEIEKAMREWNRRLGSFGVRQVLAHPDEQQLDRFIRLVQVADPSALTNVLDAEVVEFLRKFVGPDANPTP